MIPVRLTPNSLSSSVLTCHFLRRYLKSVRVAWYVPRIVARRTLFFNSSNVSSDLTITSVKLQNWFGRRIISQQGFVPYSHVLPSVRFIFLLPFSFALLVDASLLKIPRSPDKLSYKAFHSDRNILTSGFVLYTAELFDKALCA